jgi:hypothetical protein
MAQPVININEKGRREPKQSFKRQFKRRQNKNQKQANKNRQNRQNARRQQKIQRRVDRNMRNYVDLKRILSPESIKFAEAVSHPFGNGGVGAVLPDRFVPLVTPLLDRLQFDLPPTAAAHDGTIPTSAVLEGWVLWFMPRALNSGLATVAATIGTGRQNVYCGIPTTSSLTTTSDAPYENVFNAYNLCITGIWSVEASPAWGLWSEAYYPGENPGGSVAPLYWMVEYDRFANIENNVDAMRLLAAGLKAWAQSPLIDTSGYCIGGMITVRDMLTAVQRESSQINPQFPAAMHAIEPKIKLSLTNSGVGGSTVRYNPLQDTQQLEAAPPRFVSRLMGAASADTGALPSTYYQLDEGMQGSRGDFVDDGTYIPIIKWTFSGTPYTLKILSMVHCEGAPTGDSPFISLTLHHDPLVSQLKTILADLDTFPIAVKGHSFKSFMTKARRIIAHVTQGAGKFAQFMALVDKMV